MSIPALFDAAGAYLVGYANKFADTLRRIAEGEIDVAPLITGSVDIAGVPGAFATLADPDAHAKILVEPGLSRTPTS